MLVQIESQMPSELPASTPRYSGECGPLRSSALVRAASGLSDEAADARGAALLSRFSVSTDAPATPAATTVVKTSVATSTIATANLWDVVDVVFVVSGAHAHERHVGCTW